jgi:phosphoenolpyruvate synthase/pyruvate phosphate dikinase
MNSEKVIRLEGEVDPAQVGTKIARLCALSSAGIRIPEGFAVTAAAYEEFVRAARLGPVITREIRRYRTGRDVVAVAAAIRTAFCQAQLPQAVADEILEAYERLGGDGTEVAVRCSPLAEHDSVRDEVFLHLRTGVDVLDACRRCFASLFSAVAVGHRELNGPDQLSASMPVTVQRMVRSDLGASGTASGESTFVRIRAAWGLGHPPVGDPDQYSVHLGARPLVVKHQGAKRTKTMYADPHGTRTVATTPEQQAAQVLIDHEIQVLGRWSAAIDRHFGRPMELEWAKDGRSGELYLIEIRRRAVPAMTIAVPDRPAAVFPD